MNTSNSRKLLAALLLGLIIGLALNAPPVGSQPQVAGGGGVGGTCATANRLGRFTSAFTLACSLLSDDATNVTLASGQLIVPVGSKTAPSIALTGATTTGIFDGGSGTPTISIAGTNLVRFQSNQLSLNSNTTVSWSTGDPAVNGVDVSISRAGAGELTYTGTTFASLGTPANGTSAYCSDCKVTTGTPGNPSTISNNTCTSTGSGAWALRLNGVWVCVQ